MSLQLKKNDAADVVVKENNPGVVVNTDAVAYARLGWLIVLLGVGGSLLWAFFAPLDKGVPVQGNVTVSTNRKAIQHMTGGIVDDIMVKEGDTVKAGQPLMRMNDVAVKANADIARIQFLTTRAVEARLVAERDGKAKVTFPEELLKAKDDMRVAPVISLQEQLFTSRRGAFQTDMAASEEAISGFKSQLQGLTESLENQRQQQKYLKEQLDGMRDLAKDGYIARNRLLDLERTYAQVNGGVSESIGNIGRVQRQISELTMRMGQRQQEYQKEVRGQLTDVQREAEAAGNRLKAVEFDLNNIVLRSPVDGTVVTLNVFTRGGVIAPGFRTMDIVPSDDPMIVEGMVPVNLIDRIHSGLKVELIFSAFNQNKTPHIPGEVTTVSADRIVDERTGQAFYKMKAEVTPEGKKTLAHLQVRPGMPVEIFIKTGERTMMNYLLKPVWDRAHSALTEE